MLNPKIHITIQGEVGSGRSLIARKIHNLLFREEFEKLVPVIQDGENYIVGYRTYSEEALLNEVGDNPILLISVRPNGQQNQNPQT